MRTKAEAQVLADALKQKITVKGKWKTVVHENLGWHYKVVLEEGSLFLNENLGGDEPYYYVGVCDTLNEYVGTLVRWAIDKQFTDPNEAIKESLDYAYWKEFADFSLLAENKQLIRPKIKVDTHFIDSLLEESKSKLIKFNGTIYVEVGAESKEKATGMIQHIVDHVDSIYAVDNIYRGDVEESEESDGD